MVKLLCIGEIMLEFSQISENLYRKSFAGDTFNVAHYASIVGGSSVEVDYFTAIGTDENSDQCQSFIERNKVGVKKIHRDEIHSIGLFNLSNNDAGEKRYTYWRSDSAARHLFEQKIDLSGYDFVYISGITAAITIHKTNLIDALLKAKNKGAKIVFDFNYRPQLWAADEAKEFSLKLLPLVDILKISDEEFEILFPCKTMSDFSRENHEAELIFTCGGQKAEVWQAGNLLAQEFFEASTKVIDSSAAGDSFLGAYLASYSKFDASQRLKRAHRIAVQVIAHKGSIAPIDIKKLEI